METRVEPAAAGDAAAEGHGVASGPGTGMAERGSGVSDAIVQNDNESTVIAGKGRIPGATDRRDGIPGAPVW